MTSHDSSSLMNSFPRVGLTRVGKRLNHQTSHPNYALSGPATNERLFKSQSTTSQLPSHPYPHPRPRPLPFSRPPLTHSPPPSNCSSPHADIHNLTAPPMHAHVTCSPRPLRVPSSSASQAVTESRLGRCVSGERMWALGRLAAQCVGIGKVGRSGPTHTDTLTHTCKHLHSVGMSRPTYVQVHAFMPDRNSLCPPSLFRSRDAALGVEPQLQLPRHGGSRPPMLRLSL